MNYMRGKIYFTSNYIIKISDETLTHVIGYDLLTEELVMVKKDDLQQIPKSVLKLLSCERAKIILADTFCKTYDDMSYLLKVSTRTCIRMVQKHCPLGEKNKRTQIL